MRKPINISTAATTDVDGEQIYVTNAICDDGSIWELVDTETGWHRLPDIPSDEDFCSDLCDGCAGDCSNCDIINGQEEVEALIKVVVLNTK